MLDELLQSQVALDEEAARAFLISHAEAWSVVSKVDIPVPKGKLGVAVLHEGMYVSVPLTNKV